MERDSSFGHPKIYFLITSKQSWHSREWRSYGRSTSVPSTNFTAEPSLNLAEALGQVRRPPCPQVCQSLFLLLDRITKWTLDQIFTPIFLPTSQKEHEGTLLWIGTGNQNCEFKWFLSFQGQWSKDPTRSVVLTSTSPTREILLCKRQAGFSSDWRPGVGTSLVLKCGPLWDSEAPVTFAPRITLPCQACYHSRCPFDIRIYHQRRISWIFYRISFRSMVYSLPVW